MRNGLKTVTDDENEVPLAPQWAKDVVRKLRTMLKASGMTLNRSKPYIVKDLLLRGQFSLVPGPSGAKKTFLIGRWAFDICHGRFVFGRRTRPETILIVSLEGSLDARLIAAQQEYGAPDCDIWVTENPLNLFADKHAAAALIEQAEQCGAKLIIIDNLSAAMAGANENDYGDVSVVVDRLRHVARTLDAHVMGVAHMGKDHERGQRGSSHWYASADAVISVKPDGDCTIAEISKARDSRTGETFRYRSRSVDLGVDDDGDPIRTLVMDPLDHQASTPAKPSLTPLQGVRFEFIQNLFADPDLTHPDTSPAPGMKREVCVRRSDVMAAFERKGWIERTNGKALAAKERQKLTDILTKLEEKKRLCANANWVWLK